MARSRASKAARPSSYSSRFCFRFSRHSPSQEFGEALRLVGMVLGTPVALNLLEGDHIGTGIKCSGSQQIATVKKLASPAIQKKLFWDNAARIIRLS